MGIYGFFFLQIGGGSVHIGKSDSDLFASLNNLFTSLDFLEFFYMFEPCKKMQIQILLWK